MSRPRDLLPGRVQLIVVRPDEDEASAFWAMGRFAGVE